MPPVDLDAGAEPTDVPTADGVFEDVTRFTDEELRDVALGEVRSIAFAGAQDAEVQAYLVLPPGAGLAPERAVPVIAEGTPQDVSANRQVIDAYLGTSHDKALDFGDSADAAGSDGADA